MIRYITLILFIGLVWGQEYDPEAGDVVKKQYEPETRELIKDQNDTDEIDKLVLKDLTTYLGEYSKTEGDRVYFRPQDALGFQSVPVELIKQLQLKDGHYIIGKRQGSNVLCCVVVTGILVYLLYLNFDLDLDLDFGFGDCGAGCGNPG